MAEIAELQSRTKIRYGLRLVLKNKEVWAGLVILTIFLAIGLLAPVISPYFPSEIHIYDRELPPAWVEKNRLGNEGNPLYPLGTDSSGRDVLSRGLYGTRTAILLCAITLPILSLIGSLLGILSGYFGGILDQILTRLADVFYAFPAIMFFALMMLILRDTPVANWLGGVIMLSVAFISVGWVSLFRLIRASTLVLKDKEYIEAAHSIGASNLRIMARHLWPNMAHQLLVWVSYSAPQLILVEAILGYLGIGLGNSFDRDAFAAASWGGMLLEGRRVIRSLPMVSIFPVFGVSLVSIGFTLLGDGLRDALDPRGNAKSYN